MANYTNDSDELEEIRSKMIEDGTYKASLARMKKNCPQPDDVNYPATNQALRCW